MIKKDIRSLECSLKVWGGEALGYGSKSRGVPGSEQSEDAFCEAEPKPAKQGLHISKRYGTKGNDFEEIVAKITKPISRMHEVHRVMG